MLTKNNSFQSHCAMLVFSFFFFFGCFLDCVCASLHPVRSDQSSLYLVYGRLGRGGVTKSGSGPSGFRPVLFLLSGDTYVVTGPLFGAVLRSMWGRLVVAVRVNRPGVCGDVTAMLPEVDAAH